MAKKEIVNKLKLLANEYRRRLIELSEAYPANIHLGGDMSIGDVIIALYHYGMCVDSTDIAMADRDRFVMSKGHAAAGMYVAMSLAGFFDFDEIKATYGQVDSAYGMHPCKIHLPGVESSTGSLGHGLSISCGMAIKAKHDKSKYRVYCLIGDGESCEGSVWEAAMMASSYKLGNLVAVLDRNKQMMTHFTDTDNSRMHLEPYANKWESFGWYVIEIADGNDMNQIVNAIDEIKTYEGDKPVALICNTIKGKGISFMERAIGWHSGRVSAEQAKIAYEELKNERNAIT